MLAQPYRCSVALCSAWLACGVNWVAKVLVAQKTIVAPKSFLAQRVAVLFRRPLLLVRQTGCLPVAFASASDRAYGDSASCCYAFQSLDFIFRSGSLLHRGSAIFSRPSFTNLLRDFYKCKRGGVF